MESTSFTQIDLTARSSPSNPTPAMTEAEPLQPFLPGGFLTERLRELVPGGRTHTRAIRTQIHQGRGHSGFNP